MAVKKNENALDTSFHQLYFCKMSIGDIEIIPQNIVTLVIREWIIEYIPRLHCIMNDDGMLSEIFNIDDEMPITLELGTTPDDENIMEFDFKLFDWKQNLIADNQGSMISFTALLDTNKFLYPIRNRSFKNKSSVDVINQIADESNLNFVKSDNLKTSDNMTWYQINQSNGDFLKHIEKRSYRNDDLLLSYIDVKNNLNFKSLKLEIANQDKVKKARYDRTKYTQRIFDEDNEEDKKTIWYNYYDFINLNGYFNKINNYGIKGSYYDKNTEQSINVNSDDSLLAENSFKKNSGKVNDLNNTIQNNVFENYTKAIMQNEYYKTNFFAFMLNLNVNPLTTVNLFDKINVNIPSMPNYGGITELNEIYSGEYIVSGIVYSVGKRRLFEKKLIVCRDGYNKPNFEK